jgi:hypothetical protein
MAQVLKTQRTEAAQDPDAERKALADAFANIKITAAMLAEYLDAPISEMDPAALVELRAVYLAVKSGEVKWTDLMANKELEPDAKADDPAVKRATEAAAKVQANAARLKEEAQKKADAKKPPAKPATDQDAAVKEAKRAAGEDQEPPPDYKGQE